MQEEDFGEHQGLAWLEDLPPLGPAQGYPKQASSWVEGSYGSRPEGVAKRGPRAGDPGPPSISDVPGRGKRDVGRPQVSHHFLDLARRRLRPHLRKGKAETLCWDRLKGFRREIWFLVVAGYSPNFIRDFLTGELSKIFPTLSWGGVVSSVAKISRMAREGKILLDEECCEILEDFGAGPWAPGAPAWLREQYGVGSDGAAAGEIQRAGLGRPGKQGGKIGGVGPSKEEAGPLGAGGKDFDGAPEVGDGQAAPAPVGGAFAGGAGDGAGSSPGHGPVPLVWGAGGHGGVGAPAGSGYGPPPMGEPGGLAPALPPLAPVAPMGDRDRVKDFVESWKMMAELDPSLGSPTLEEMELGISRGFHAVIAFRKGRLSAVPAPVAPFAHNAPSAFGVPVQEPGLVPAPVPTPSPVEVVVDASPLSAAPAAPASLDTTPGLDPEEVGEPVVPSPPSVPSPVPSGLEDDVEIVLEGFEDLERLGWQNPLGSVEGDAGEHPSGSLDSLEEELRRSGVSFEGFLEESAPRSYGDPQEKIRWVCGIYYTDADAAKWGIRLFTREEEGFFEGASEYLRRVELGLEPNPFIALGVESGEDDVSPEAKAGGIPVEAVGDGVVAISPVEVLPPGEEVGDMVRGNTWELRDLYIGNFIETDPASLVLEGHATFFPELESKRYEEMWAELETWRTDPEKQRRIPPGMKLFIPDRELFEDLVRKGYTYRELHGVTAVSSDMTAFALLMEELGRKAFGLPGGVTDPVSGKRYVPYAPVWSDEFSRRMLDVKCSSWWLGMTPYLTEFRKPLSPDEVPYGYRWLTKVGLVSEDAMDRAKEVFRLRNKARFTSTDKDVQENEIDFCRFLIYSAGEEVSGTNGRVDPFRFVRTIQDGGFEQLPFGLKFLNKAVEASLLDHRNATQNYLHYGRTGELFIKMLKAIRAVPVRAHLKSMRTLTFESSDLRFPLWKELGITHRVAYRS